jgi:hypothetical protein
MENLDQALRIGNRGLFYLCVLIGQSYLCGGDDGSALVGDSPYDAAAVLRPGCRCHGEENNCNVDQLAPKVFEEIYVSHLASFDRNFVKLIKSVVFSAAAFASFRLFESFHLNSQKG